MTIVLGRVDHLLKKKLADIHSMDSNVGRKYFKERSDLDEIQNIRRKSYG